MKVSVWSFNEVLGEPQGLPQQMEVIITSHHAVCNMSCIIWAVKDLRLLLRLLHTFLLFWLGVESLRERSNEVFFINLRVAA